MIYWIVIGRKFGFLYVIYHYSLVTLTKYFVTSFFQQMTYGNLLKFVKLYWDNGISPMYAFQSKQGLQEL